MNGKSGSRSGVLQWVVVLVVGVLVVTVVLGLNLIPRLSDGQKVLDAARPAFNAQRLTGTRAGIAPAHDLADLRVFLEDCRVKACSFFSLVVEP